MRKITFLALFLLIGFISNLAAQQPEPLPIDPNVRHGTLENGLTYYVRHNSLPKNRAEFFIAQKVGSVLEEENQRGLAHFLEHMAFNGTKNFPDKSMLNYLESIGVKFGANVNAYTAFDETVYNLSNVPVARESVVDSCLLILHDWACAISLEDKEIDNERGVIHEEWRTRNDANLRMWDKVVPEMFVGSQYANRMPIGLMEVVDNFSYQTLRDYYHKWYRPDQQGIIVVGDIDAEKVEAKIKEMFGKIQMPANPAERIYYPVPDNKEPIVVIGNDKEATSTRISVYYKHDVMPRELKATPTGLVIYYMQGVATTMLNNRLDEITQKADAPFLAAGTYDGNFFVSKTKDAFTAVAISKEGGVDDALAGLVRETERVNKFGFTASEYERAKADFLRSIENIYMERDKRKNDQYVDEYVSHFTDGGSISGIEMEYNLFNQIAPNISVEQINQYIQSMIGEENIVITINGIEKEGLTYPTKDELLKTFNAIRQEDIKPYEDKVSNEPLITKLPKPGKIKKATHDKLFDATVWTLSNGAKVVIKPTTFKDDEILMKASSIGGSSQIDDSEIANIKVLEDAATVGGIGNFSVIDLQKALAGKKVSVSTSVGEKSESVTASCSPKDLETMMQLVYLNFTANRKDDEAFNSWKNRIRSQVESMNANPMLSLVDTLIVGMYNNDPRKQNLKTADIDAINYDKILSLYNDRFKDASDFTFTFVGNIQIDSLKPLVEKYIASLPATKRKEDVNKRNISMRKGTYTNNFDKEMETLKSSVYAVYSGHVEYSTVNIIRTSMLKQIMDIIYTETIREEEGGTYGVMVQSNVNPINNQIGFLIYFDTDPAKREKLLNRALEELAKIAENGPSEVNFNKVKEYMLKKDAEDLHENSFWLGQIDFFNLHGIDTYSEYSELINKQTPADIQKFAKELISQGNLIEISMNGIQKK